MIAEATHKNMRALLHILRRTTSSAASPRASASDLETSAAVSELLTVVNSEDNIYKLSALKGISKIDAAKIYNYRESNGPITDVSQLCSILGKSSAAVLGIAEARLQPTSSRASPKDTKKALKKLCTPKPTQEIAKNWSQVFSYRFNAHRFSWMVMERNFTVVAWGQESVAEDDEAGFSGGPPKLRCDAIHKLTERLTASASNVDCVVKERLDYAAIAANWKSPRYQLFVAMLEQAFYSTIAQRLPSFKSVSACEPEPSEIDEVVKKEAHHRRVDISPIARMFEFDFQLINRMFDLNASKRSRHIPKACVFELLLQSDSRWRPFPVAVAYPQDYEAFIGDLTNVEFQMEGAVFLQAFAFCYLFGDVPRSATEIPANT